MYYGLFKDIRESAWKCLLEFEIEALPVDILKITRKVGISVVKNSSVGDLMPNEYAKSYFNGHRWIVIYDDTKPVDVCRFAIAHELGHFFLGHDLTHTRYANIKEFGARPKAEQQADMFALRTLALPTYQQNYRLKRGHFISRLGFACESVSTQEIICQTFCDCC